LRTKGIPLYPPERNWFTNPWSSSNILSFVEGNLGWSHAILLVGPRVTLCALSSTLWEELGFPLTTALEPSYQIETAIITQVHPHKSTSREKSSTIV